MDLSMICVYRVTGCAVGSLHPDSVKQMVFKWSGWQEHGECACDLRLLHASKSHVHLPIRDGLMTVGMETQLKHNSSRKIKMMTEGTPDGGIR